MKTFVYILVGVASLAVIAVAALFFTGVIAIGDAFSGDADNTRRSSSSSSKVVNIDPKDYELIAIEGLLSQAEENGYTFDQKYAQQPIFVVGDITQIYSHPVHGGPVIDFECGLKEFNADDCSLHIIKQSEALSRLKVGDGGAFNCFGARKNMVAVELFECFTDQDYDDGGWRHQKPANN